MIPVWDPARALGTAVDELPRSVRSNPDPAGSIAVVAGPSWVANAVRAVDAGARAILVVDPAPQAPATLEPLHHAMTDRATARGAVPVLVLRRRLAPDRMPTATGPVAAVVAECAAPAAQLPATLRDTIGWARVLADSALTLDAVGTAAGGHLASLSSAGGTPVSLVARTLSGVPDGGVLRLTALGTTRRELVVDEAAGLLRISVTDEHGETRLASPLESPERAALRRAVAALVSGEHPDDLEQLVHDAAIADAILASAG